MSSKNAREGEEAIVIKAQGGDTEALEWLLAKYQKLAFYIALNICHCDADADDIVQESFVEVAKSIHRLQEPKYFKAWLNRIIFSKSTKLFRGSRDVTLNEHGDMLLQTMKENRRYLLPENEMAFQSDADILRACVNSLPEKMRKMIYMMYFEQMSIKEIAYACELPEGTVKSRLNYARKLLKEAIQEYEDQNDYKLTFRVQGMEAILFALFAKEASGYLPFVGASKPFSFKGHVIEPSLLAMAVLGTCATVGVVAAVYAPIKDYFSNPVPKEVMNYAFRETSENTFPMTMFQGQNIQNEKGAYRALTQLAHCEVELKGMDESVQRDARNLYEVMRRYGGAYFDLLKNRHYFK